MGIILSWLREAVPPASKFSVDDIPDLSGKVVIVTGGSTGIGRETVKALLTHNAKVYIAARNEAQSKATITALARETGNEAIFLSLDLASLRSVKAAAEEFMRQEVQLDILFNNAGVMVPPVDLLTEDGYDLQFGTNVLGHFYFTKLLLPLLASTARRTASGHVRVVTTSSSGHLFGSLDFDTFRDDNGRKSKRRKQSSNALYCQSKFGNVVFALELTRRHGADGIVSTSLNPGNIQSDLQRHIPKLARKLANIFLLYSTPKGALTQLYAGTAPEAAELNGKYLVPWARLGQPKKSTQDPKLGEKLWDWLEEQVKNVDGKPEESGSEVNVTT
ncbi:NAD(P)-binding protein [Coniophora puteana RWD-64-598 SS2]|uniref:NAD(P)-binding protein n=1 Tax=Coniophora puteana (strain RWD-64-598) TaxID=741705 RepID=A0A5M3MIM4_CONPW|nr:NAD(P)-binding protein [Coniophora puteana RWD-64-598 SS2]EIW79062.1 NAD(P)-binding protein [Coniophora puteana RWD-64-598 SS2]